MEKSRRVVTQGLSDELEGCMRFVGITGILEAQMRAAETVKEQLLELHWEAIQSSQGAEAQDQRRAHWSSSGRASGIRDALRLVFGVTSEEIWIWDTKRVQRDLKSAAS